MSAIIWLCLFCDLLTFPATPLHTVRAVRRLQHQLTRSRTPGLPVPKRTHLPLGHGLVPCVWLCKLSETLIPSHCWQMLKLVLVKCVRLTILIQLPKLCHPIFLCRQKFCRQHAVICWLNCRLTSNDCKQHSSYKRKIYCKIITVLSTRISNCRTSNVRMFYQQLLYVSR